MNEDDTYKRLVKVSFKEVQDFVVSHRRTCDNEPTISEWDKMIFNLGWTSKEYNRELEDQRDYDR